MKKILSALTTVLTVLLTVFAVCVMIFTVFAVRSSGGASVFGWRGYVVLSDSMRDTFAVGDIIVSKPVDPSQVQPGDIITFTSTDPNAMGEVFSHKVRAVNPDGSFTTYGTTTGDDDLYPALPENLLGEYAFHLPKLGYFFQFLRTPMGYLVVILLPILALIGFQVYNIYVTSQKLRRLQRTKQARARRALEEERRKNAEMQAELERLRRQADQAQATADTMRWRTR